MHSPAISTHSPPAYALRRAQETDAAAVAELMNHPQVYAQTLQLPFASPAQWVERLKTSSQPPHLVLVAPAGHQIAGMAGLHPVNGSPRSQHARSLGIMAHPDHWGTGVARHLMQTLLEVADGWMGVSRVELTVFTDNVRAIRLYERFGFEREGTHRRFALREGVWVDAHSMARLKPGT